MCSCALLPDKPIWIEMSEKSCCVFLKTAAWACWVCWPVWCQMSGLTLTFNTWAINSVAIWRCDLFARSLQDHSREIILFCAYCFVLAWIFTQTHADCVPPACGKADVSEHQAVLLVGGRNVCLACLELQLGWKPWPLLLYGAPSWNGRTETIVTPLSFR